MKTKQEELRLRSTSCSQKREEKELNYRELVVIVESFTC